MHFPQLLCIKFLRGMGNYWDFPPICFPKYIAKNAGRSRKSHGNVGKKAKCENVQHVYWTIDMQFIRWKLAW